jgi:GTP-binding protein Era
MSAEFHCGYVALVGRPNVGKSTLLNRIVGQKISITSRRPQTTRHRVLGIKTLPHAQLIYVDTPGIHDFNGRAMNRYMNRTASTVLADVDVVVFLVDGLHWTDDDELVLKKLALTSHPVILAVNKIDLLERREALLPGLQSLAEKFPFAEIIPVSARKGDNIAALESSIEALLPEAPPLFPEDQVTDRSVRFLAAELVREKLFRKLGRELPYGLTVQIEQYRNEPGITHIHALIWVERDSQKNIVIGKGGRVLKDAGREARKDIEDLIGNKVNLKLWVKTKEGWADDERALQSLGYTRDD